MSQFPRPIYISSLLLLSPIIILPWFVIFLIAALFLLFRYYGNPPAPANNVANFFRGFQVGGHRGAPTHAPENTLFAFKMAKDNHADSIEFDVGLTRDGVPVLMHDDTLDRTTNMTGLLRDYDFDELASRCNCGAHFTLRNGVHHLGRNEPPYIRPNGTFPICTLEEVVRWSTQNRIKMLFDVKDADSELADQIEQLFERYNLYDRAMVCSFFPWVIYRIKRKNNNILTGLTWRRRIISYVDEELTQPRYSSPFLHCLAVALDALQRWSIKVCLPHFLGADMVLVERSEISENLVTEMTSQGIRVCAWIVNEESEMVWMSQRLGIPIITDETRLARQVLKADEAASTESTSAESN